MIRDNRRSGSLRSSPESQKSVENIDVTPQKLHNRSPSISPERGATPVNHPPASTRNHILGHGRSTRWLVETSGKALNWRNGLSTLHCRVMNDGAAMEHQRWKGAMGQCCRRTVPTVSTLASLSVTSQPSDRTSRQKHSWPCSAAKLSRTPPLSTRPATILGSGSRSHSVAQRSGRRLAAGDSPSPPELVIVGVIEIDPPVCTWRRREPVLLSVSVVLRAKTKGTWVAFDVHSTGVTNCRPHWRSGPNLGHKGVGGRVQIQISSPALMAGAGCGRRDQTGAPLLPPG